MMKNRKDRRRYEKPAEFSAPVVPPSPEHITEMHHCMKSRRMYVGEIFMAMGAVRNRDIRVSDLFLVQEVVGRVFHTQDEMLLFLESLGMTGGIFLRVHINSGKEQMSSSVYGETFENAISTAIARLERQLRILHTVSKVYEGNDAYA